MSNRHSTKNKIKDSAAAARARFVALMHAHGGLVKEDLVPTAAARMKAPVRHPAPVKSKPQKKVATNGSKAKPASFAHMLGIETAPMVANPKCFADMLDLSGQGDADRTAKRMLNVGNRVGACN